MRAPPPVDFPLQAGAGASVALAACVLALALGVTAQAMLSTPSLSVVPVILAGTAFAGVVMALLRRWQAYRCDIGSCRLCWDGRDWALRDTAQAWSLSSVRVRLDGGRWLLLDMEPAINGAGAQFRPCWVLLPRSTNATQWHALRAALIHARPMASGGVA